MVYKSLDKTPFVVSKTMKQIGDENSDKHAISFTFRSHFIKVHVCETITYHTIESEYFTISKQCVRCLMVEHTSL